MQFRVFQPGVILPPDKPLKLPEGTSVADQQGGRQADQDRGEAGGEEMGNHRRSTGSASPGASPAGWANVAPRPTDVTGAGPDVWRRRPAPSTMALASGARRAAAEAISAAKRLDRMSRQIDQLQKSLDELRQDRPKPPPPATEQPPHDGPPGPGR